MFNKKKRCPSSPTHSSRPIRERQCQCGNAPGIKAEGLEPEFSQVGVILRKKHGDEEVSLEPMSPCKK